MAKKLFIIVLLVVSISAWAQDAFDINSARKLIHEFNFDAMQVIAIKLLTDGNDASYLRDVVINGKTYMFSIHHNYCSVAYNVYNVPIQFFNLLTQAANDFLGLLTKNTHQCQVRQATKE
jgi:hypothetical protein